MKISLLQSINNSKTIHKIPMERFYDYVGITRQGYSQAASRQAKGELQWANIEEMVHTYRKNKDRRAGSRSLFYNLDIKHNMGIGVNKFEKLISERGLSLAPLCTRVVTTTSSKQSWNYPNRVSGLKINGINQIVVGDLTYLNMNAQRYYLFCLTDIYSARIVGYCISYNMRAVDALKAAKMWIRIRKRVNLKNCIHHTDGGVQYFSGIYLNLLNGLEVQISRAETCLENGYAEQRNGLIKHHLLPTINALGKDLPRQEMKQIIKTYNYERKQEGLGWLSPVEFERKVALMGQKPEFELFKFEQK